MSKDYVREEIRKQLTSRMLEMARANNCQRLGRLVDKDVLTKCVLSDYRMINRNLKKTLHKQGDLDEVEKFRAKYGDAHDKRGEGIQTAEIPLDKPLELIYWEHYNENFYGGDIPDTPKNVYICPHCNMKYMMSPTCLPLNCKSCGWQTPLGRLVADGFYKKV